MSSPGTPLIGGSRSASPDLSFQQPVRQPDSLAKVFSYVNVLQLILKQKRSSELRAKLEELGLNSETIKPLNLNDLSNGLEEKLEQLRHFLTQNGWKYEDGSWVSSFDPIQSPPPATIPANRRISLSPLPLPPPKSTLDLSDVQGQKDKFIEKLKFLIIACGVGLIAALVFGFSTHRIMWFGLAWILFEYMGAINLANRRALTLNESETSLVFSRQNLPRFAFLLNWFEQGREKLSYSPSFLLKALCFEPVLNSESSQVDDKTPTDASIAGNVRPVSYSPPSQTLPMQEVQLNLSNSSPPRSPSPSSSEDDDIDPEAVHLPRRRHTPSPTHLAQSPAGSPPAIVLGTEPQHPAT